MNYNFSTKVFVNALLQYNTDSHQLSSNIRFNIIHRPLSDFFFVYNEHRDELTGLMQDRSLIAKMTYMVASKKPKPQIPKPKSQVFRALGFF